MMNVSLILTLWTPSTFFFFFFFFFFFTSHWQNYLTQGWWNGQKYEEKRIYCVPEAFGLSCSRVLERTHEAPLQIS